MSRRHARNTGASPAAPVEPPVSPPPARAPAVTLLALLLTLAPLLHVFRIVSTTGTDTPSSDYVFSIGLLDRILSGDYAWTGFFRDTFIQGAHCMALPILARLAIVRLTDWNIYAELYLTLALFAARLLLLFDLLTFRTRRRDSLWLWPALAALLFTVTQIDVFTYGDAGLQIGFVQFGFTLGLWGLVRFPIRLRGAALASLGGLLATWSGGGGLLAWPVLLLGLVLCGYRRPLPYLWLSATGCVAALPYAVYLISPPPNGLGTEQGLLPPDLLKIIAAIGQPLVNGVGGDQNPNRENVSVGLLGLGLLAVGTLLIRRLHADSLRPATLPALLMLAWGFLNVVVITMLREAILSWYTTAFLSFWIGLVGLAYAVCAGRKVLPFRPATRDLPRLSLDGWSGSVLAVVALLYVTSNLSYEDKVMFFLPSRAPAAAASVRHYQTAPTYAEEIVFVGFSLGHATYLRDLAYPLEKHGLSQFRTRQQWTLQGEFFLDHVRSRPGGDGAEPFWTSDRGASRGRWRDYHRLDLLVPPGAALTWNVELPTELKSAELVTALHTPAAGRAGAGTLRLIPAHGPERELFRDQPAEMNGAPVRLSLSEFAGQQFALRFAAPDGGPVVFRHPVIDLSVRKPAPTAADPEVRPSNLDPVDLPARGGYAFDLARAARWIGRDGPLGAAEKDAGRVLAPGEFLHSAASHDLPLAGFDRLALRITAGPPTSSGALSALRVTFLNRRANGTDSGGTFTMTLLPDGKAHHYTYPLRLLEAQPGDRLSRLRLFSVSEDLSLRIHEVRLIPAAAR